MKPYWLIGLGLCSLAAPPSRALDIQFTSIANTFLQFNGSSGTFQFSPVNNDFQVTAVFDSPGDSLGDLGGIAGKFSFGVITTHWNPGHIAILYEDAPALFSGVLTIHDGHGHDLTATLLDWMDVLQVGTDLHLNTLGLPNLSGFAYSGTQADLVNLADESFDQTIDLEASILGRYPGSNVRPDLYRLQVGGRIYRTAFHGEIVGTHVPDGGATAALLALTLPCLGLVHRRIGGPGLAFGN